MGAVFGTHVVLWNIVPFCADCDADSNGNKLVKGIPAGDLKKLAVLQKLWLTVRPPPTRSHAPTVAFAAPQEYPWSTRGVRWSTRWAGKARSSLSGTLGVRAVAGAAARHWQAQRRVVRRRRPRVAH